METLQLLSDEELYLKLCKIRSEMAGCMLDGILISTNANIYYLTGRVFSGFIYISSADTEPIYFVKRPVGLSGDNVIYIHKPENIIGELSQVSGMPMPRSIGIELDLVPYSMVKRLEKALGDLEYGNASMIMRIARSTKTPAEIDRIRVSGIKHRQIYDSIPALYKEGMSDIDLQIEIERISRMKGCLGQFRISGDDMELHMGNILTGDNADVPSPYDFAMGGAGADPSLPVGADGTVINPGMAIMVDMNGNFTGYMTDMTRTFALGEISEKARYAHRLSINICHELAKIGKPGTEAKTLYEHAYAMVRTAGMEEYFMGHNQHAAFIGHGLGIEINELPVISPRSRDILTEGNIIALEPKFVIPGTGAVGIENTYLVSSDGMECLTDAAEEIIYFDR